LRFAEAAGLSNCTDIFGDAEIDSVCIDSRAARAGCVFVCLPGGKSDGHAFIQSALQNGASAVVVSNNDKIAALRNLRVPFAIAKDTVDACWRLCKAVYGDPTADLKLIGVTGTNGKTTTAWLIAHILEKAGMAAAYSGTLGALFAGETIATAHTTPFAPEANELMCALKRRGAEAVVMEVSSHALEQRRIDGFEFDCALFTNLSQDHLDFHDTMDAYFGAKCRLFEGVGLRKTPVRVINADDVFGKRLLAKYPDAVSFGENADTFRLVRSRFDAESLTFDFLHNGRTFQAAMPIGGRFNVMNGLAAVAGAFAVGVHPDAAIAALRTTPPVRGRFEPVPTGARFSVIVDYAHTPDALEKLLISVVELHPKRVITVFGCGGDRDRSKRPKMGAVAAKYSTKIYVTSDNPRTENPNAITEEIVAGMQGADVVIEPDRRAAIRRAVESAQPGDLVVIAGKGHEDYQIVGDKKYHLDDREEVQNALRSLSK
jgi:UDP-N-acetylmuramyl-tripeptide synthetase